MSEATIVETSDDGKPTASEGISPSSNPQAKEDEQQPDKPTVTEEIRTDHPVTSTTMAIVEEAQKHQDSEPKDEQEATNKPSNSATTHSIASASGTVRRGPARLRTSSDGGSTVELPPRQPQPSKRHVSTGSYNNLVVTTDESKKETIQLNAQQVWQLLRNHKVFSDENEEQTNRARRTSSTSNHGSKEPSDSEMASVSFVHILHALFQNWTTPPLTMEHMQAMWDAHQSPETVAADPLPWPEQPMLHASHPARPLALLCHGIVEQSFQPPPTQSSYSQIPLFWQLPTPFLQVFLRILTRLITLESDDEYTHHVGSPRTKRRRRRQRQGPPRLFAPIPQEPPQPDLVYNVARLSCCGGTWDKGKLDDDDTTNGATRFRRRPLVLFCIQSLVEFAMSQVEQHHFPALHSSSSKQSQAHSHHHHHNQSFQEHQQHYSHVLPSLIYLLGVWGITGMTPLVLRRWLALIQSTNTPVAVRFRDELVRALTFATQYSSLVLAPPKWFFSFQPPQPSSKTSFSTTNSSNLPQPSHGGGGALKRAIRGLTSWPFRNDFGMATWFRTEHAHQKVNLVSVRTDRGAGWIISLQPLAASGAYTVVVSVYDSGHASPTHQLTVSGCVLVPRNWYHIAVRHTRSRLKGVFSLSTRQQLVLLLDGKIMVNQPLPFPRVETKSHNESTSSLLLRSSTSSSATSQSHSSLNLEIEAAVQLEGQMGALYIFRENVSDAAFRGIYEATGGKDHRRTAMRRSSFLPALTSTNTSTTSMETRTTVRHNHLLSRSLNESHHKKEDSNIMIESNGVPNHAKRPSVVPSHYLKSTRLAYALDFDDPDNPEADTTGTDTLLAFRSKVFLVWDPQRAMDSLAFELHVGAHVQLDDYVHTWNSVSTQDVIASIGGVQALVPLFRSMIAVGGTGAALGDGLSVLANLFHLLAAFVHGHDENAHELVRCGGIDVIEQLLLASKRVGAPKPNSSVSPIASSSSTLPRPSSLFAALCANDWMATELVESLLVLLTSAQHCSSLEIKIFERLLFNIPLWMGSNSPSSLTSTGAALHLALVPALSFLAKSKPEKVRDCVGAKEMIHFIRDLSLLMDETKSNENDGHIMNRFLHGIDHENDEGGDMMDGCSPLTLRERRHVRRIVLGMIFEILISGTSSRDLGPLLRFISGNMTTQGVSPSETTREPSLRHQIQLELCTMLLLLLQLTPPVPGLMESFAQCCGSVQGGVGWILSVMVKPADEKMMALGIRCVFAYLRSSTKGDDHPISLHNAIHHTSQNHEDANPVSTAEAASLKTVALASSTVASFAKGLASMGPGARASMVLFPSKLTARVVWKLMWNFLKTHRFILGPNVRSALLYCMSDSHRAMAESMLSSSYMANKLVIHGGEEQAEMSGCWFSYDMASSMLQQSGSIVGRSLQNKIAIATVLRLLRHLPAQTTHQWLIDLLSLLKANRKSVALVSSVEDWQSSLFHLVSVTVEELSTKAASTETKGNESSDSDEVSERRSPDIGGVSERLDLSLELYGTLLGHLLREGGEKALDAVEHTASLQRVCANGQVVLLLVLSVLCADLFDHGTLLEVGSLTAEDWKDVDLEQDSLLLKQSAKLVTDAILSNGTEGLDMAAAVKSWRSLRHLAEVVVAVVSKSGLGVVDLFAYNKHRASAIDSLSGGLHGIRLPDTRLKGTTSAQYANMLRAVGVTSAALTDGESSHEGRQEIDRRLCVTLSAQVLTLLDAFIFPESLDTSLPASQLHGLALVRNSEPRLGAAQGPLIASAIRLSFLLTSALEPCSVRMLQCVSRLRCLVQWALDLIRESSSLSSPIEEPEEKIASLDRMLLAVVLHCHRTLGRCAALLSELDGSSVEYFGSKDAQKKHYRRLLRVALELRDVVTTTYRGRNAAIRKAMSTEAVEELRSSLEASGRSSSRETALKEFLSSSWVTRFQDVEIRGDISVPEQVSMDTITLSATDSDDVQLGISSVERLANESMLVQADFEKALDVAFEGYLETQRKWADTENVWYLEHDGDTTIKKLSEKYENDVADLVKEVTFRRHTADIRWNSIHRSVVSSWSPASHWKLAEFTDRVGRRTLLVPNRNFSSHIESAYDSEKGGSTAEHTASPRGDNELTDLIRRNSEAFAMNENKVDDDDLLLHSSDGESTTDVESSSCEADDSVGSVENDDIPENTETEHYEEEWDKIDSEEIEHVDAQGDVDGWARAFAWSENESVVARFEPVMIVKLQTYIEGNVLLTSHHLYFKSTGGEMDVMTKSYVEGGPSETFLGETKDRRWHLSRLSEIHGRRYLLRQQAIELFFCDGQELFLNFLRGSKERDRFHAKLRNNCKVRCMTNGKSRSFIGKSDSNVCSISYVQLPLLWSPKSLNPRTVFRKSKLTELWRKRKITNFEYLMALNRMSGRSFNDITQYPVFPWVLAEYSGKTIDLRDSRVFRDLSKPIGALNPDRLAQLLERFKDLELFGFPEAERFLYGSHYSSPGVVLHLMIRQEPFTTMSIALQSGRFDCPDRLFFDLAASWDGCLTSTSDMKELVPEVFSLPEMFQNTNKFPLGKTQSGLDIDDVRLPPWANGSAFEFVRIQRLALESEYVSQNLHHWIDLVFGYKQRGEEAEAAHNVFHHLSYEGSVDLDKITDEVDRTAAESHIQNFGQTPSQLLQSSPHPERYLQEECWKPLIHDIRSAKKLRSHTPSKQFGNMSSEYARGAVIKIHALSDSVVAVYGDMSIGSYRFYPSYKHNRLRMDRLRPLSRRELSVARDAIKRGSLVPPDELTNSDFFLTNLSFALTIGGRTWEELRRTAVLQSGRLMSGSETTIASAEASAILISCGYWDGTVKAHSSESLKILASENGGHQGPIHCLAMSNDGFMLTGGKDCTCRIWLVDHPEMSTAMMDEYVQTALGGSHGSETPLVCCHVLWGHETPVLCVDLDSDMDVAVSGSRLGLVCVHTVRRGEFVRSFSPPTLATESSSYVSVVKLSLDHSGSGAMIIHMADRGLHTFTVNGMRLASVDACESLNDMRICAYGEMVVTGGDSGKVAVRQVSDLSVISSIDLSKHGPIRCITLTPEELNPVNQFLFVGSDDGSVTVVDRDSNSLDDVQE